MKKTIKEWLMELPDGYRERALSQADEEALKSKEPSLFDAVCGFQLWHTPMTKEGDDFWFAVKSWAIDNNNPLPPLPKD